MGVGGGVGGRCLCSSPLRRLGRGVGCRRVLQYRYAHQHTPASSPCACVVCGCACLVFVCVRACACAAARPAQHVQQNVHSEDTLGGSATTPLSSLPALTTGAPTLVCVVHVCVVGGDLLPQIAKQDRHHASADRPRALLPRGRGPCAMPPASPISHTGCPGRGSPHFWRCRCRRVRALRPTPGTTRADPLLPPSVAGHGAPRGVPPRHQDCRGAGRRDGRRQVSVRTCLFVRVGAPHTDRPESLAYRSQGGRKGRRGRRRGRQRGEKGDEPRLLQRRPDAAGTSALLFIPPQLCVAHCLNACTEDPPPTPPSTAPRPLAAPVSGHVRMAHHFDGCRQGEVHVLQVLL